MSKIFFQSSLPRAGSTLLQNIVGQNPDFYVTPTSGVVNLLLSSRSYYTTGEEILAQDGAQMKSAFLSYCKGALEGYFKPLTSKPYILDKSRAWGYNLDFLSSFYLKPKIICMIRDPRSIFSSMEKNYRKHPDKSPIYFPEPTKEKPMGIVTLEDRVEFWSKTTPVGLSLEMLKDIILRDNDHKILFVKYENLFLNPQQQLNNIYDYLEIPRFEHDFNNIHQITHENDKVYGIYGDHKIKPVLKMVPPDYNEILGIEISQQIKELYSWFYDYFKYD
jgi:sulfotransferase